VSIVIKHPARTKKAGAISGHSVGAMSPTKDHAIVAIEPRSELPNERTPQNVVSTAAIVHAIMEVGNKRKKLLDSLQSALESGNEALALDIARQLCGLAKKPSFMQDG
jgi:hypothetical protein